MAVLRAFHPHGLRVAVRHGVYGRRRARPARLARLAHVRPHPGRDGLRSHLRDVIQPHR